MNLSAFTRTVSLSLAAACLVGCSGYSKVIEKKAKIRTSTFGSALIKRVQKKPSKTPEGQIGRYLNVARLAATKLENRPDNEQARKDYNFAVARIFEVIHDSQLEPWKKPLICPGFDGDWTFSVKTDGDPTHNPSLFRTLPADRYEFRGRLVKQRTVKEGIGAPMITTSRDGLDFTQKDPFIMGKTVYYGVTLLIDFNGRNCTARYYDPLETEDVQFAGRTYPLAADFTAPIALALAELKPRKRELEGMFRPDKVADSARLARLQPYNPNKIPILCIHGLGDSQATWAPLIETLRGDPVIRQHYQFWFFSFPTGFAYPLMTEELRKDMNAANRAYPGHKDFVVLGHSTGGMIARQLMTDSGMKIWNAYFPVPPKKMPLSPGARKMLEGALIFDHRHDVSRVIFASASLRGSEVAVSFIGKLGQRLIGSSKTLLGDVDDTMKAVELAKPAATGEPIMAMPNSIDALDPENRFLTTINNIPPNPGIPFHSIIGDRGKGGNLDKTKPMSTDGLVPYWSSHIDGAESELVIPSGHWTHQDPAAIQEVRRILYQHIGRKL